MQNRIVIQVTDDIYIYKPTEKNEMDWCNNAIKVRKSTDSRLFQRIKIIIKLNFVCQDEKAIFAETCGA